MAQYRTIYRLEWNTVPSVLSSTLTIPAQAMRVDISDTENLIEDWQTPEVIALQPAANPLITKVINNDEDKFTPIRAKQAIIQFVSDANQFKDTLTFADSSDNRWKVDITEDGNYTFRGFLMMSDIDQSHLPDPNIVTLTASDHLALLKDIPLTTDAGENPSGKYKVGNLIGMCLKKTGLNLNIVVINNLRHGTGSTSSSSVVFASADNSITVDFYIGFFYVGQQFNVTGSVSNNFSFIVTEIVSSTKIKVNAGVTNETTTIYSVTFSDSSSLHHFYDIIYLDALTFETNIGECDNCYTVLEKILGEDCFLTQWKGSWYIMRINEFDNNPIYECVFTPSGFFSNFNTATSYAKSVGAGETRILANADALRRYDRPAGSIKELFNFETPQEVPCNVDFVRGDVTTDPDVQVSGYTSYDLDCWTVGKGWGSDSTTTTNKAAIVRKFNTFNDELDRFILLTMPTYDPPLISYLQSSRIPISTKDKFTWSFDVSTLTDPTGDGFLYICKIVLYGVSGTVYTLHLKDAAAAWYDFDFDVETTWKVTDTELSLFFDTIRYSIYDDADHPPPTEWTSISMEAAEVPEDGELVIYLLASNQFNTTHDNVSLKFKNLNFNYHPFIGGLYGKYKKFHNKVTLDPVGYFNSKREKTVYIADSPKPLFKGAMFFYNGVSYVLTTLWYNSALTALGNPGNVTDCQHYGYWQSFSVWNQYRNGNRILNTSALGLGSMWPDILDKWSLTDSNPHVNNRYFMLISLEQNWKTALWSGVFIEVYRTDLGRIYTDDHEFKYLIDG